MREPRCWHFHVFGLLKWRFFPSPWGLIEVPAMAYRRLKEILEWQQDHFGIDALGYEAPLTWRNCMILDGWVWDYAR